MPNSTDTLALDLNGTEPLSTLHDYLDLLDAADVDVSHASVEIEAEGGVSLPTALLAADPTPDSTDDKPQDTIQAASTDGGTGTVSPSPAPVGPDYSPHDADDPTDPDDDTTDEDDTTDDDTDEDESSADVDTDTDQQESTPEKSADLQSKHGGSKTHTPTADQTEPPASEYERGNGLKHLNSAGTEDDLRTGVEYWGRINGVQNYGVFVSLADNDSVSGLLHRSNLPDDKTPSDYSEDDELVVVVEEVTDRGPALALPHLSDTYTDTDTDTDSNTDTDSYTDTDTSTSNSSSKTGLDALGLTKVGSADPDEDDDTDDEDDDDGKPVTVPRSDVDTERPDDDDLRKLLRPGYRRYQTVCVLARADDWLRPPDIAAITDGTPWEAKAKNFSTVLLDALKEGLVTRRESDDPGYEYALVADVVEAVRAAESRVADTDDALTYADVFGGDSV